MVSNCFKISAVDVVTRKKMAAEACSANAFKASPPDIRPILTVVDPGNVFSCEKCQWSEEKLIIEINYGLNLF